MEDWFSWSGGHRGTSKQGWECEQVVKNKNIPTKKACRACQNYTTVQWMLKNLTFFSGGQSVQWKHCKNISIIDCYETNGPNLETTALYYFLYLWSMPRAQLNGSSLHVVSAETKNSKWLFYFLSSTSVGWWGHMKANGKLYFFPTVIFLPT